jgi:pimeloyl-ACP methyl ester carboxylesterase
VPDTAASSSYLYLNGLRIHYLRWPGQTASPGRACVLLHGLASNARIWERTAPILAAAGMPVYALDLRGHGLTDKPDAGYDFNTIGRDVLAFLQSCDLERPLLAGHSWGASVALEVAARYGFGPPAPAGIALVDGGLIQLDDAPPGQPAPSWDDIRRRLEPPRLAGLPLSVFLSRLGQGGGWQPDQQAVSIILANFEVSQDETITPRLTFEHHMQIVRAMWEFPTYQRIRQLRCPALALPARPAPPVDARSLEFLRLKEYAAARVGALQPRLRVQWMDDTVHDIPLQRPAELAQALLSFSAGLGA